jgi:hypothetical protein
MAQAAVKGQRLHAALMGQGCFASALKHFRSVTAEMLQEKAVCRVDLGENRP